MNAVIISLEMFVRLDANVIIALLMLYHPLQISKYINHFSLYLYLSFLMCIIYTNINFYFVHCNIIWHRHHPNHQTLCVCVFDWMKDAFWVIVGCYFEFPPFE